MVNERSGSNPKVLITSSSNPRVSIFVMPSVSPLRGVPSPASANISKTSICLIPAPSDMVICPGPDPEAYYRGIYHPAGPGVSTTPDPASS